MKKSAYIKTDAFSFVSLLKNTLLLAIFTGIISVTAGANKAQAQATDDNLRYVTDIASIALRSGQSDRHRIVLFLKSNTLLTLLESNPETGYSKVSTRRGTEGWILSDQITSKPTSKILLVKAQQKIERLTSKNKPLHQQMQTLESEKNAADKEVTRLTSQLDKLSQELSDLKSISSNAINLDRNNRSLLKENQMLKNGRDVLTANNDRLKADKEQDAFINGALAVGFGVLIALIVPRLAPRKKRNSEWA